MTCCTDCLVKIAQILCKEEKI